jgi:hypothetical protein
VARKVTDEQLACACSWCWCAFVKTCVTRKRKHWTITHHHQPPPPPSQETLIHATQFGCYCSLRVSRGLQHADDNPTPWRSVMESRKGMSKLATAFNRIYNTNKKRDKVCTNNLVLKKINIKPHANVIRSLFYSTVSPPPYTVSFFRRFLSKLKTVKSNSA